MHPNNPIWINHDTPKGEGRNNDGGWFTRMKTKLVERKLNLTSFREFIAVMFLSIFQIRYFNPKSRDFYFHGVTPAAMTDLTKNNNILVKKNNIKFIYLVVAIDTNGFTLP